MQKQQSELTVIMKAKELCAYVATVTQKSPKHFRYTYVSRLQNLAMDVLEKLYRANDVYAPASDPEACAERLGYQRRAMTDIRLLCWFAMLAMEQGCILPKQYEQISRLGTESRNLLGGWMNSDRRRSQPRERL